MARRIRSPQVENRTNRLKLPVRRKPYYTVVAPNIAVGYRKNRGAGTWSVRAADGHGGAWIKRIGLADDFEDADGTNVLDYWQAQQKAREIARGDRTGGDRPATVAEALEHYADALRARGAEIANATRVKHHLSPALASKLVGTLTAKELRAWRDGLIRHGVARATADRTARVLAAALTQAAHDDARIANREAWRTGLKRLPGGENVRHAILDDATVRAIVAKAYEIGGEPYGLLIETLAVSGQRFSQLARLTVGDLQDGAAPRLLVPSSRKGKARKSERRPLPIPASLAVALRRAAADRPADAPLLTDAAGAPWPWVDLRPWREATAALGLDRTLVPYALRHSSIVRMLLAGTPTRLCAAVHDTSVDQLERVYSKHIIGDSSDVIVRRAQLDLGAAPAGVVVPLGRKL